MAERRLDCDVAVVGAGPAGLSAARAAASAGARVVLLDPQPRPGGQVWRNDVMHGMPARSLALQAALRASPDTTLLMRSEAVAAMKGTLFVHVDGDAVELHHAALVLATGARELLLPFPGWTLPGVTGAGGAQALAKQGWPLRGKRVLLAGTGPLLLAAGNTLRAHGAQVLAILEQAPLAEVAAFAAGLWRWPGKARQAAAIRAALWRTPYRCNSHVLRAFGEDRLRAVQVSLDGAIETVECDQLACGFGLVPNVELAQSLGCELAYDGAHPRVMVDDWQRSSVEGVLAAGEACGIGGLDCAEVEGAIAGHVAVAALDAARALWPRRRRARRFAADLQRRFALGDHVRALADDDTILCRCEDVPLSAIPEHMQGREAKLATRCGMGACQGRVCGTALAELRRVRRGGLRPPVFPVSLEVLAGFGQDDPANPSPGVAK
ncbi:MAG: NAD(P)/FAD-dependent oxidoreductase [Proteobacteria bacterium]|nr:NAD(P)/FAD-dependent oxidoreductase [Pseudomonadota bacterium]